VYQKILVPIDGSEHSKRALHEALNIAKMTAGTISLLNVLNRSLSFNSSNQPSRQDKAQNTTLIEGQKIAQAEGVSVETLQLEGNVIDQIVKTAKEGKFDLIVVGARGLSKLEEIMLGSVSHGVLENSPCPVIVTR